MPPQSRSVSPPSYVAQPELMDRRRAYQQQSRKNDPDQRNDSTGSANASHGGKAPSSVYLACTPLTRDLSDLSGSYMNGKPTRKGSKVPSVPGHIYDQSSLEGPWRQAYSISKLPPQHKENVAPNAPASRAATILVSRNNDVEIVDSFEATLNMNKLETQGHNRTSVSILLMDGGKHSYELMQIWIDRTTDSVRDVVQALQQSIPDKWRQAYDGIFQVRGSRFTQLINILRLGKYDVQPHEILIAKPWSMTAKVTIAFATSAIRHLTNIGTINTGEEVRSGRRVFRPKSEETPLMLSKEAQDRIYAPEGIFSHHHAVQFLTFSPPFDSNHQPVGLSNDDANSSLGSSIGSDPLLTKDTLMDAVTLSPKSITKISVSLDDEIADLVSRLDIDLDASPLHPRGKLHHMVSKLNCRKTKERVAALKLTCCQSRPEFDPTKLNCCKSKMEVIARPLASLSEEQAHQWARFDIRPIAEDQSSGHSTVSMSKPLLSIPQGAQRSRRATSNVCLTLSEF